MAKDKLGTGDRVVITSVCKNQGRTGVIQEACSAPGDCWGGSRTGWKLKMDSNDQIIIVSKKSVTRHTDSCGDDSCKQKKQYAVFCETTNAWLTVKPTTWKDSNQIIKSELAKNPDRRYHVYKHIQTGETAISFTNPS